MSVSFVQLSERIVSARGDIVKVTFSSPDVGADYPKITTRPVDMKSGRVWQAERFRENKVFHLNVKEEEAGKYFETLAAEYRQIAVFFGGETETYSRSGSGFKCKKSSNVMKVPTAAAKQNNRQKEYILREGDNIPALVDLGVFTEEFRVVSSKYDKYKQINRFIELIDDAYGDYKGEDITILDFGCGKSYLTFIVYYYFVKVRGIRAKIIGYDLKRDVVENCNKIAEKYGYTDLEFVVSDVTKDVLYDRKIDMVISLHACDTATDYALWYAVSRGVKNIFSVPCCQHEVNKSIKRGGELDVFLKYGIVKERVSALLTDTIRAMILEDYGYSVDLLEFVDLSHSPKNIMIRAKKCKNISDKNLAAVKEMTEKYSIEQTLYRLAAEDRKK
ncbi:MAG: SAM-dependent methyltransferase [Clostridia bacterium]|nr:SAM-dependent methyltransferase [Clostridia bacterium]